MRKGQGGGRGREGREGREGLSCMAVPSPRAQWVTAAVRMPIVIEMRFFTERGWLRKLGWGWGWGAVRGGALRESDSSKVAASAVAHRGRAAPMSDG